MSSLAIPTERRGYNNAGGTADTPSPTATPISDFGSHLLLDAEKTTISQQDPAEMESQSTADVEVKGVPLSFRIRRIFQVN